MSTQQTINSTPATHHRFHILDALRGIAAIFVVCWHAPSYVAARGTQSSFLAVDFFFCLSGFVIAFSYERRLASFLSLGRFALARWIRLYPVYLLGCVLGAFTFLLLKVDGSFSSHLLPRLILMMTLQFAMLPNLHIWDTRVLFPLNYPSWSMFFEMLANIGYAALLRKRLAGNGVLVGIVMVSLAALIFLTRTHSSVDVGWLNGKVNVLGGIARVAISFIAGVLVLRIYRGMSHPAFSPSATVLVALAIGVALALLLLTPLAWMRTKPFQIFSIVGLFPALVYCGSLCKAPSNWTGICAFLGDISYPMYLLHHFVFTILTGLPLTMRIVKSHPGAHPLIVPMVLLITAGASFCAVRFYDAPLRAFLTRKYNAQPRLKAETAVHD